jgi:hypothetical protein
MSSRAATVQPLKITNFLMKKFTRNDVRMKAHCAMIEGTPYRPTRMSMIQMLGKKPQAATPKNMAISLNLLWRPGVKTKRMFVT